MGRTGWRLLFPGYLFSTACSRLWPEKEESGRGGERGHDPHLGVSTLDLLCETDTHDDRCSQTCWFRTKTLSQRSLYAHRQRQTLPKTKTDTRTCIHVLGAAWDRIRTWSYTHYYNLAYRPLYIRTHARTHTHKDGSNHTQFVSHQSWSHIIVERAASEVIAGPPACWRGRGGRGRDRRTVFLRQGKNSPVLPNPGLDPSAVSLRYRMPGNRQGSWVGRTTIGKEPTHRGTASGWGEGRVSGRPQQNDCGYKKTRTRIWASASGNCFL